MGKSEKKPRELTPAKLRPHIPSIFGNGSQPLPLKLPTNLLRFAMSIMIDELVGYHPAMNLSSEENTNRIKLNLLIFLA